MGFAHTSRPERISRQLLQFDDGTVIVDQRQLKKVYDGYKFMAGHRFTGVAADAEVNIVLIVPSGSNRRVFFLAFEVSSFAQAHIDVYFDVSFSGGTALKTVNLRRSKEGPISPVAQVFHSVSYTPSEYKVPLVHSGGTKQFATGGLSELGGAAILDPGNNALIAITNKSTSSQDISIRIIWWEEPTS